MTQELLKSVTHYLFRKIRGKQLQSTVQLQKRLINYFTELEHYDFFSCDKNFITMSSLKSVFFNEPTLRLEDFVTGDSKPQENMSIFLEPHKGRVRGKYLLEKPTSLFFLPVVKDEVLKSFSNQREEKVTSKKPSSFLIYIELDHMLKSREDSDLEANIKISPVVRFFLRKGKKLEELKTEIAASFSVIFQGDDYGKMDARLTLSDSDKNPALLKSIKFVHIRLKNWEKLSSTLHNILASYIDEKHLAPEGVLRYAARDKSEDFIKWSFNGDTPFSSFYIKDLGKVKDAAEKGGVGEALRQFLDVDQWANLQTSGTQFDFFHNDSLPEIKRVLLNIPTCKWPSPYPLSLMQQVALNLIHEKDKNENGFLFSVNGPPGTGKTTLLKDSFANILFDKVSFLSRNPNLLNSVKFGEGDEEYFYSFPKEMRKYRILVVSNNNAAVENISKDLPLDEHLMKPDKGEAKGYEAEKETEIDCRFLGFGKVIEGETKWGSISAAMGNQANLNSYFTEVWEDWNQLPELVEQVPKNSKKSFVDLTKKVIQQVKIVEPNSQFHDIEDPAWQTSKEHTHQYTNIDKEDYLTAPRSQLFMATMDEYLQFLNGNKKEIEKNLKLAQSFFLKNGSLPKHLFEDDDFIQAMYDTVFLVTPILSSTFASVPRFLEKLEKEDIGWLFIDEAGMATPQSALGAIWRSRNVIAVGDPLQIAPVNPLRADQLQHIAKEGHGFSERDEFFFKLTKPEVSVQEFADSVNQHGGKMIDAHQNVKWLGSPLRVHRRCEDPMFSICNQTTYQNKMIHGLRPSTAKVNPMYQSQWINMGGTSKENGSHFIKGQGIKAFDVAAAFLKDHPKKTCFIITPFVTVKTELEGMLKDQNQKQIQIGTVHKFQGKEAPLVIFVLGVDDNRKGPLKWASSTPNLLNVAASRAKNHFVVIGNADTWGKMEHFKEAHQLLKRK